MTTVPSDEERDAITRACVEEAGRLADSLAGRNLTEANIVFQAAAVIFNARAGRLRTIEDWQLYLDVQESSLQSLAELIAMGDNHLCDVIDNTPEKRN